MSKEEKLVLKTKESLYSPIEVEIDGTVYKSRKLTREVRVKMGEIDSKVTVIRSEKGGTQALFELIEFVFGIEKSVLEKLEQREVEDIYFYFNRRFAEIEKERMELVTKMIGDAWKTGGEKGPKPEIPKNRKRPGDKA